MCRPTNHKGKSQWVLKGHRRLTMFWVYLQRNHWPPLACNDTHMTSLWCFYSLL